MKVFFDTLGCKINQYETQAMREQIFAAGGEVTEDIRTADYFIINTCVVTEKAEKTSLHKVRKALRDNPGVKVVVTGCLAELPVKDKELRLAELIVKNEEKKELAFTLGFDKGKKELEVSGLFGHKRSFLKIEDGCENFCAYCIVPFTRGKIKSRPLAELVNEAVRLSENGYAEIVLTGINLGAYGKELEKKVDLPVVLSNLLKIKNLGRLRLSSLEPEYITPKLLDIIAESKGKVCPHLHVPLQSGDDAVLSLMNRRYTLADYSLKLERARKKIKDLSITTDMIVGFPGETEKMFENSLEFMKQQGFLKVHVFSYSDRRGTKAASMKDKVQDEEKERRYKKMLLAAEIKGKEFVRTFIGKELEILAEGIEKRKNKNIRGFSGNYIKVNIKDGSERDIGKIIKVRLERVEKENHGTIA
ncbi:MAG: tRNA (N(6)-L-threonylcarbamoyladenosine(37)-C(2))-methylthiotransferase MtaB [Candidatus Firestonebacteria bacterium]